MPYWQAIHKLWVKGNLERKLVLTESRQQLSDSMYACEDFALPMQEILHPSLAEIDKAIGVVLGSCV